MGGDADSLAVYQIPSDALKRPWVSRSFIDFLKALRSLPRRRLASVAGPALLSIVAHALLIGSVLRGGAQAPTARIADRAGPGSSGLLSTEEPVMTLILINEPAPARTDVGPIPLASRGFAPPDLPITLISPDAYPALDAQQASRDAGSHDAPPADDAAIRGVLYGRYVGQIRARIERAWMRPRTAIGAAVFSCVVQISQDSRGNVRETTLQDCNGDGRWQLSLVQAIQSASPLPAPPNPKVFADAFTMRFEAQAFGPGSNAQDYEPLTRVARAAAVAQKANGQLQQFEEQLHSGAARSKAIELTIIGDPEAQPMPSGWEPTDPMPSGSSP